MQALIDYFAVHSSAALPAAVQRASAARGSKGRQEYQRFSATEHE
jgi:hypothetical protein